MSFTWIELAELLACPCHASDAWQCARWRQLCGSIACSCACHGYIDEACTLEKLGRIAETAKRDCIADGVPFPPQLQSLLSWLEERWAV